VKNLLRAFGLILGIGAPLFAAPSSPPAGNYIQNVSTNASVQVFKVTSGTVTNLTITGTCSGAGCGTGGGGGLVSPGTFTWTNNFGTSVSTVTATIYSSAPVVNVSTITNYPNSAMTFQLYNGIGVSNSLSLTDNFSNGTILTFGAKANTFTNIENSDGISSGNGQTGDSVFLGQPFGAGPVYSGFHVIARNVSNDKYALSVDTDPINGIEYLSVSTNGVVNVPLVLTLATATFSGQGNASITEGNGTAGQIVISTAGAGVTVGHCAQFGSSMTIVDAGASCGTGGGGGTPGAPVNSVQYNSASAFAGSNNFQFNGTSVTVQGSSVTIKGASGGASLNTVGLLDVYQEGAYGGSNSSLVSAGSSNQADQFDIYDQKYVAAYYGYKTFGLLIDTNRDGAIESVNSIQSKLNLWNNGEVDIQSASTANGGANIVLMPNTVPEVVVSSLGVTVSTIATIASLNISSNTTATQTINISSAGVTASSNTMVIKGFHAITVQSFLSGSGTYTTPAGVQWIRVRMVGGGAGGSGGGVGAGTNPTQGSSTTLANGVIISTAGGGQIGLWTAPGGTGGSSILSNGMIGMALSGGSGGGSGAATTVNTAGGQGGSSALGGAGGAGNVGTAALNGATNTGGGGGGGVAGGTGGTTGGSGGGAGGFIDAIINAPAASYTYSVGGGGNAGGAGTNGAAGGAGGSGAIWVEEHYTN
jgi:hypothetical protein